MANKDYYKILGVSENASDQEIKKAYRELAKKYHPDRHKGDAKAEERFKEISEAYGVLNNPQKRARYDQMRKYGAFGGGFGESGSYQNVNFEDLGSMFSGGFRGKRSAGFGGLGDIFSDMFGGRGGGFSPQSQKGGDISAELTIAFDVAISGGKQTIRVNSKRLSVNIPAGVEDGKKIRLRGQGQPGMAGGPAGDLIVTIHVAPHPVFRRQGADIYSTISINMVQAALGDKVRVLTYNKGSVDIRIPPGTPSGKKLKLKGLGINVNNVQGDHYIEIHVTIPHSLSPKAKEYLKKFAAEAGLGYKQE